MTMMAATKMNPVVEELTPGWTGGGIDDMWNVIVVIQKKDYNSEFVATCTGKPFPMPAQANTYFILIYPTCSKIKAH